MKRCSLLLWAVLLIGLAGCGLTQKYSRIEEHSFEVSQVPLIEIDNFAGDVSVQSGESDVVQVVVTRRAAKEGDLDRIEVEITPTDGGLTVRTDRPSKLNNTSVELEIKAPPGTRLDLRTGAGRVTVRGIDQVRVETGAGDVKVSGANGDIDLDTGAGDVDVRNANGQVRVKAGAGDVDYEGNPLGNCSIETGAGDITLRLSRDAGVRVDLSTGAGKVEVDFEVDGSTSKQEVRGSIGNGDGGEVRAHTGAGDIDLIGR